MKKKLLFVMNNLNCGGAEKSLISLLQTIDYSAHEVDLFLFKHEGMFLNKLPQEVNLLDAPVFYPYFDMSIKTAVVDCVKYNRYRIAAARIGAGYVFRTETNSAKCEQKVWRYLSKSLVSLSKEYDAAIGYLEKTPIYYIVEKVKARTKIGFIHNDYDKLGLDPKLDIDYFEKLDHIVTVSDECANILKRRFPDQNHKVNVIHNIVSPKVINHLANEDKVDIYNRKHGEIVILSIGRLHAQKGFELAINTGRKLVDSGWNFQWNIIGEGEERERLAELIAANGLEKYFRLLGLKLNPYPYIKQADIYAQTSKYEGKSIAIDEAKILNKPILVTNFSTAKDQIKDGIEGLIVDMNTEAVAAGIGRLMHEQGIRSRFSQHLSQLQLGTEKEIEKLYKLLG